MKNYINKLIPMFFLAAVVLSSCEEESKFVYEGESFASWASSSGTLIINPAADTENVFNVGVTSTTPEARSYTVSVSDASTLDPSYYSISGLEGSIAGGEYFSQITITTFATTDFPATGSQLILELVDVANTDPLKGADSLLVLDFLVACAFDGTTSAGTYTITADEWEVSLDGIGGTFEVVAGPEANQVTLKSPFGHPNPDGGTYDVIVNVNPDTGAAEVPRQDSWHCDNWGCSYGTGRVNGTGFVFSCLESMQFSFQYTVDAGSFGSGFAFAAEKQ